MKMLINDPELTRRLIRQRRVRGLDRKDEVWEGVYVMAPSPNTEHEEFIGKITTVLTVSITFSALGKVLPGVGVSDRDEGWTKNYRVPDNSVFLKGTTAINKGTHWLGGPDFAVEVISPGDRSRKKFKFYARVGVKELLLVDRKPWALELYQLQDGVLTLAGKSDLVDPAVLSSQVVPLSFQLVAGEPRPTLLMTHSDGIQRWSA